MAREIANSPSQASGDETSSLEVDAQSSLADKMELLSHVREIVSLAASGTPASKFFLSQLSRVIKGKSESSSESYSDFMRSTRNPLIKWFSKSPTISLALGALDKSIQAGIVTDAMLMDISQNPEILGSIINELASMLSQPTN